MINPFDIYRRLRASEIPIAELELETIKSKEWGKEDECKAAILTIAKNPDKILIDPNLFSQVSLALFGIEPDFEEYEILTSELIEPTLELIKLISSENNIPFNQMTNDLLGYLAVCCIEEGLYFLENNLIVVQQNLIDTARIAYNVNIKQKDLDECKALWEKYKDSKLEDIPDSDANEHQILINRVNKEYTRQLTQI